MRAQINMALLVVWLLVDTPVQAETHAPGSLDQGAMERAIGKLGELKDGVYKVSLPRKDLVVVVNGVTIRPGLALGTWLAFKENNNDVVMDGDLVLKEAEVGPVMERLQQEGIQVTALHNHLIGESPRVMYVHVFAKGDGVSWPGFDGHLKRGHDESSRGGATWDSDDGSLLSSSARLYSF